MNRLVDRFGRTGFAALTSMVWALPMAAWAGSADLSPIDRTAYPGIALGIGAVMLVVWLVIVSRLGAMKLSPRQHRLDLQQMSGSEKRWALALVAFAAGTIAWLNAAATVDLGPLVSAVAALRSGPIAFATALVAFLAAMLTGVWASWRRSSAAFEERVASSLTNVSRPES